MYGSLSQFIQPITAKERRPKNWQQNEQKQIYSQQKIRNKSLVYFTQDKSILLESKQNKLKIQQLKTQKQIKFALYNTTPTKSKKSSRDDHWIQSTGIKKISLKRNLKLLHAVAKTREQESFDNRKTSFDKSMERVKTGYKKVKTEPIDVLLPPKMPEIAHLLGGKKIHMPRERLCLISPLKMLELQKSIKWGKNHGQRVTNFYESLGKSIELQKKQKNGKSNYLLQLEQKQKQEEVKRRGFRKNFLKQIEKRLHKFSA